MASARHQEGHAIATAPKKTASRKVAAKKPAAKKPASAKKPTAKKPVVKKPVAKKPAIKKLAAVKAKKPVLKKIAAKKTKAAANAGLNSGLNPGMNAVDKLHQLILKSLDDDKAEEVVSIPLAGKSSVADYIVVASGRSSRQVSAIADHLMQRIHQATGLKARVEGKGVGDWVLIDSGDIVVHIFRPEIRGFYKLEKMWGNDIPDIELGETSA